MSIPHLPANTRLATDLKIYRRKIRDPKKPHVKEEVKKALKKKAPTKYPNPNDDDIYTGEAYRDLASWQSPSARPQPNRLGGGLDNERPGYLDGVPDPKPPKIKWTPPDHDEITVDIREDGAVVHKKDNGDEIHDAHHYMHAIFDRILYKVRDLLEDINKALEAYAKQVSVSNPAQDEANAYTTAVNEYEKFLASLQPGGTSAYSGAFNFVGVSPVVTNEGFIVSCRVKLNWKNPYHSSSTIKIP